MRKQSVRTNSEAEYHQVHGGRLSLNGEGLSLCMSGADRHGDGDANASSKRSECE